MAHPLIPQRPSVWPFGHSVRTTAAITIVTTAGHSTLVPQRGRTFTRGALEACGTSQSGREPSPRCAVAIAAGWQLTLLVWSVATRGKRAGHRTGSSSSGCKDRKARLPESTSANACSVATQQCCCFATRRNIRLQTGRQPTSGRCFFCTTKCAAYF